MLDLAKVTDHHVCHAWVRTIHSAQGPPPIASMAHLESFGANTVDAASVYVAISRARDAVALYTDSSTVSPRPSASAMARRLGAIKEGAARPILTIGVRMSDHIFPVFFQSAP
jgi:hypothetical protein